MLQLKKPLAFIDIEATGANVSIDRIVEIAIVKVQKRLRKYMGLRMKW
jgi:DNA polymerase-3 subunit epsilon